MMISRKYSFPFSYSAIIHAVYTEAHNKMLQMKHLPDDQFLLIVFGPPLGNRTSFRYILSCRVTENQSSTDIHIKVYPGFITTLVALSFMCSLIQSTVLHVGGSDNLPVVLLFATANLIFQLLIFWQEKTCEENFIISCGKRAAQYMEQENGSAIPSHEDQNPLPGQK